MTGSRAGADLGMAAARLVPLGRVGMTQAHSSQRHLVRSLDPEDLARLREAARARALTHEKIAQRCGVTKAAVTHWFNGRHVPGRVVARLLVLVVGVDELTAARVIAQADATAMSRRDRSKRA